MMDDGCTDGTVEAVTTEFPQVIILKGDGNLFWNRGMYKCWQEAVKSHHDFYLWLNDDTMLFDNALEVMFKDYATTGEMSIISGCCCDTATQTETTYGGRDDDDNLIPMNGELQKTVAMNGNVVLIPNCVVDSIGIIDPYFKHSAGDNEYSFRAKKWGIPTYITSAFVATCDRHDGVCKSSDSHYTLKERWHYLNTPWGARPKEKFYLYSKYKTLGYALKETARAYLRCLFPVKRKIY